MSLASPQSPTAGIRGRGFSIRPGARQSTLLPRQLFPNVAETFKFLVDRPTHRLDMDAGTQKPGCYCKLGHGPLGLLSYHREASRQGLSQVAMWDRYQLFSLVIKVQAMSLAVL